MTRWPTLTTDDQPTLATLHLASQMIGKLAVALLPWENHGWHVTLTVIPRGLESRTLPAPAGAFRLRLDLTQRAIVVETDDGGHEVPLAGTTAATHAALVATLANLGLPSAFDSAPNELAEAIPFAEDERPRVCDPDACDRLRRALPLAADALGRFRTGFLGKASPVQFWWGSFDLAVQRFSGDLAPPHPGGVPNLPDPITREAYERALSSAGFFPGGAEGGEPAFYSYAYPAPDGFATAADLPYGARWDTDLKEYILPWARVAEALDPDAMVQAFFTATYGAAADLGGWDRDRLDAPVGRAGVVRPVEREGF